MTDTQAEPMQEAEPGPAKEEAEAPEVQEDGQAGATEEGEGYDRRGARLVAARAEDLAAVSADGAPLIARASLVGFHVAPSEVVARDREVGPHYYEKVVRPTVQSGHRERWRQVARWAFSAARGCRSGPPARTR